MPNRPCSFPPGEDGFRSRTAMSVKRSGSARMNGTWKVRPARPTPSTQVRMGLGAMLAVTEHEARRGEALTSKTPLTDPFAPSDDDNFQRWSLPSSFCSFGRKPSSPSYLCPPLPSFRHLPHLALIRLPKIACRIRSGPRCWETFFIFTRPSAVAAFRIRSVYPGEMTVLSTMDPMSASISLVDTMMPVVSNLIPSSFLRRGILRSPLLDFIKATYPLVRLSWPSTAPLLMSCLELHPHVN